MVAIGNNKSGAHGVESSISRTSFVLIGGEYSTEVMGVN
jgi:hypothetical protein